MIHCPQNWGYQSSTTSLEPWMLQLVYPGEIPELYSINLNFQWMIPKPREPLQHLRTNHQRTTETDSKNQQNQLDQLVFCNPSTVSFEFPKGSSFSFTLQGTTDRSRAMKTLSLMSLPKRVVTWYRSNCSGGAVGFVGFRNPKWADQNT